MAVDLGDAGFEQIAVGVGENAYVYNPTGSAWTFSTNSAGVTGDGSAFSDGNPNAPEGTQVGFLQGASSISQTVSGWDAGDYTISFQAAQRGNHGVSNQTVEVTVDDVVVATFTPSGTSYETDTTPSFTVTAGAHTIKLVGLANDDETVFVDSVAVTPLSTTPTVGDAGFEQISVGVGENAYVYNPTGSAWTFSTNSAGVTGDGSAFSDGNPDAPEGTQVGFLQGASSISQTVSGWDAGAYTISFQAAQRGNHGVSNQTVEVTVDDVVVATFTPSGTSYETDTTPSFTVTAGAHTIKLLGLANDDETVFVDSVVVAAAEIPASPPTAPTGVTATATGSDRIDVSWSASPGASSYSIERSADNGSTWTTVGAVGADVTTFTDLGLQEVTSYTYRIVAANAAGDSAPSATVSATTPLTPPTNLTATAVSYKQINLAWTAYSSTAIYDYIEQSTDGTIWTLVGSVPTSESSYTATGAFSPSTVYYFRVRNYAYFGGYSTYATVSTLTPAFPNAPAGVQAVAASASAITVSWNDVANEVGFRIEQSADHGWTWTTVGIVGVGVTTFTDSGLHEATPYTYRIVATNVFGDSAPSAAGIATTLSAPPTDLTVAFVSSTKVNLSWTNHSASAHYYDVEQSPDGATWTPIGSVGSAATAYTATGLFNGSTTYYFRVRVSSFGGVGSDYATTSATTPAFPGQPMLNTVMAQSDSTVVLIWGETPRETGFRVERQTGSTWTTAGTVGVGVTTFIDSGLHEASSYTYRIVATNVFGDSIASTTRTVFTLLAAPTGLKATAVSPTQVDLSWTNHSTSANYYDVEQSPDGTTWTPIGSVGSAATAYTATGPFNGSTTYYFRVRATSFDIIYFDRGISEYVTTAATTSGFPSRPTLNSASAQSDSSITLEWTDVASETDYRIERSADGGSTWTTAGTVGADATAFTDLGLAEATNYTYRVIAVNTAGDSAPSVAKTATTLPSTPTMSSAPTGLTTTVVSPEEIDLAWTSQYIGQSGYRVQQAVGADGAWRDVGTVGAAVTTFTATGPFDGSTTYRFRVWAYNAAGVSAAVETSVVIPAFPARPTDLVVTSLSESTVGLAWSPSPNATTYRIDRRTGTGPWVEIGVATDGATQYTDSTVVAGTVYAYAVSVQDQTMLSARSVVGPALARDGAADEDDDGLSNIDEANLGTDPTYFDTDGDLLPDGWEARYDGFDPKSPTPAQGDADGDGLTNLAEYTHDTDPTKEDTDGDGVSDFAEIQSGADPNDPSDGGAAPADDMKAKFRLTTGDPSGSHSERWELQVGDVKYQSPGYGVVGSGDYYFQTGEDYEIRMRHLGTDPEYVAAYGGPNYDWTASVALVDGDAPYWIDDQGELLRTHIQNDIGPPNLTEGKVSYLHVPQLDVDVDSDDDDGFNAPGRTAEEDRLEGATDGAKILTADVGDVDGDGVPDYADFDGVAGLHFVPVVVSLSDNVRFADPSQIKYTFTYDASDPSDALRTGSGAAEDPYVYRRTSGKLRVWTKDASSSRDVESDYIEPGRQYTAAELGLEPGGTLTLYVESVAGSEDYLTLDVSASVTGAEWSGTLKDKVYLASTETRYVAVEEDGSLTPVDEIPFSNPAPVFSNVSIAIDPNSLHLDPSTGLITGDVVISGHLEDAASDLIAGLDGVIGSVGLYLNGDVLPLATIDTIVSKSAGGASLLHPYAFSADFAATLQGVELQAGWNAFHIEAVNAYGYSGSASRSIAVDVDLPTLDEEGTVGLNVGVRITHDGDPRYDSSAAVAVSWLLGGGEWTQPIRLELDANAPAGVFRFTDGVNVVDVPDDVSFDPLSPDQYDAVLTIPAAGMIDVVLPVVESSADSGQFDGLATLDEDAVYETYVGVAVSIGESSSVEYSQPGDFRPILIEVVGPQTLRNHLTSINISESLVDTNVYTPVTYQGRSFLGSSGAQTPKPFLMTSSPKLAAPQGGQPAQARDGVWSFAAGFGAGLMDTGVNLWDGVKSVASGTWHVLKNYNPFTVGYRYLFGENIVTAEDQQAAYTTWDVGEALAGIARQIMQDQQDVVYATLVGDNDELNRIGEKYSLAFEYAVEILQTIKSELLAMDAYQAGRIAGRVIGETLAAIVTAGVANATKGAILAQVSSKLKSVSYVADAAPVLNKLDDVAVIAEEIATTSQCFVAGTMVLTSEGLRPIETIRKGDLVLSRSESDGHQTYKPVLYTVVTHPSGLHHVNVRTDCGASEELVGTGEHPFYVTNKARFVRAEELQIGDVLRMADGKSATVASLTVEEAVGDATFTTYNFEVADYHTYFVGKAGVWVHNVSTICEKAFSLFRQHIGYGETPEQAFDRVNQLISKWITRGRLTEDASLKELGDTLDSAVKEVRKAVGKPLNGDPAWNIFTKGTPRDGGVNLWEYHWLKHKDEFPGVGPVDYVLKALETAESAPGPDILVKTIVNKYGLEEKVVMDLTNGYFTKQMLTGPEVGSLKTFFVRNGSRANRIAYFNGQ